MHLCVCVCLCTFIVEQVNAKGVIEYLFHHVHLIFFKTGSFTERRAPGLTKLPACLALRICLFAFLSSSAGGSDIGCSIQLSVSTGNLTSGPHAVQQLPHSPRLLRNHTHFISQVFLFFAMFASTMIMHCVPGAKVS